MDSSWCQKGIIYWVGHIWSYKTHIQVENSNWMESNKWNIFPSPFNFEISRTKSLIFKDGFCNRNNSWIIIHKHIPMGLKMHKT
jgi:hypothetical protein